MGAIFALVGWTDRVSTEATLSRVAEVSRHRGELSSWLGSGWALGCQSLGWDSSVVEEGGRVFAVHGYLSLPGAPDEGISSAEALASVWNREGPDALKRLDGEFAMLVADPSTGDLMAACSVGGTRPLFCGDRGGRLVVATEVRQVRAALELEPQPGEAQLIRLMMQRPVGEGATLDRRVSRIYPGRIYRWSPATGDGSLNSEPFWRPPQPEIERKAWSASESAERLRQILKEVVEDCVPGQPWALSLSGGRDSSAIWALADRSAGRPVSLEFPGMSCDERRWIEETIRHVGGPEPLWIDGGAPHPVDETLILLPVLDAQPFATTYFGALTARAALADGRRVLLKGNGGDEWLGGTPLPYLRQEFASGRWLTGSLAYLTYELPDESRRRDLIWKAGLRPVIGSALRRLGLRKGGMGPTWLTAKGRELVEGSPWPDWVVTERGPVRRLLARTLHRRRTSNEIWTMEQVAAQNEIEVRLPFMHRRLIDFAFTVPPQHVIAGRREKHLLRVAFAGLYAPAIDRRRTRTTFDEVFERRKSELVQLFRDHEWSLSESVFIDRMAMEGLILECSDRSELRQLLGLYMADRFVATLGPVHDTRGA